MKNISPNRIFSRILEIHEPRIASAGIRISLADQAYKPGDELKADILITNKKKEPEAVSYSYSLSDSNQTGTDMLQSTLPFLFFRQVRLSPLIYPLP